MTRLPYLDPDEAEPKVADLLGRIQPLGIFRIVAQAQRAFPHWLRMGGALLDPAEFDPVLRELAILRVATLTPGADYEWVQHVAIHRAVGGSAGQMRALRDGDVEAEALGQDGRLVVGFTTQVVRDARPDDETYAAMQARFTSREIVQLLLVIGQYMMIGRVMATVQIDLDPALNVLEPRRED
ncbi:MAG TPA: carboxymuconolactone decarboxylase family protein [Solirubrobacteraceae bacterium]|jgi:alkylhydroperoxidase family enzyme|nr:carboxymuconolactone decarboxylase family protein [Solirubrobacteraceae bacterium]